jgi:hypothetical protein
MELIRVNNFNLAEQYITEARDICSDDPLIYNEFGVIYYKNKEYPFLSPFTFDNKVSVIQKQQHTS